MELEHLRMFLAVAECGSFTEAAKRLFVSHSTTSRAVSALERELGAELFRRHSRIVKFFWKTEKIPLTTEGIFVILSKRLSKKGRIMR